VGPKAEDAGGGGSNLANAMADEGRESGSPDFGALLRHYRLAAGLSQDALAERARVSSQGISALERGFRRAPQRETLALLAGALALSDDQRRVFEAAAARPSLPRRRAKASVTVGPWPSAQSASLPFSLTSFVGRDVEIDEIDALIRAYRLVTVTGAGGVGKTQTALHAAAEVSDLGEGLCFVALAPLRDPSLVASAIATALGVQEVPHRSLLETLTAYLKSKALLLILDNCEHLVEAVATVVRGVLSGCPDIRVLATSREPLATAGERTYRLPSLSQDDAIALFADRAQAVDAHFALTSENTPAIDKICRRLDGIPLAIELAAARVNVLPARELLAELDNRFRILKGGERTALPRQQTMRATIDWSYNLLSVQEQRLLQRLSVFAGGCTMAGAAAVCAWGELCEDDLLDLLSALVAKSLVVAEPYGEIVRYRLLESTRAYAAEKLVDAGESDVIADRHLRYLRDLFAELQETFKRTLRSDDLVATLQAELQDVRFALDDALARSAVIDGGELFASIRTSWEAIGLEAEATARCEAYLAALPAGQPRLRAQLLIALVIFLSRSFERMRPFELARQAVECARASGDDSLIARALLLYAQEATHLRRFDDAERAFIQAEAMPETSPSDRIYLLAMRANMNTLRGDLEAALPMWEQLRNEQHLLGGGEAEQTTAQNLAEVEHMRGQTQRAIEIVRETLPAARAGANKLLLVGLLGNLSGYLAALDDLHGAAVAAREGIRIRAAMESEHIQVAIVMEHLALVSAAHGDLVRAAMLEGYADAAMLTHDAVRGYTEDTTHARLTTILRDGLAPEELTRLTTKGAALSPMEATALALDTSTT
jgi:predicted ATPase/DNA-binding XRE family transcriptional regulator